MTRRGARVAGRVALVAGRATLRRRKRKRARARRWRPRRERYVAAGETAYRALTRDAPRV